MIQISPAWLAWPETQTLIHALGSDNIRFVGGCVRDALLDRAVLDVDVATSLLPEQTMTQLQQAGIKAIPTGITHGTVTAVIGIRSMEITTLRKDVSTDGRHATVAYTDNWQEDASRRDFTMNALYCDAQGNLTDFFGGVEDAQAGRVRFIGDARQRIQEDALRILRFFRFVAGYNTGSVNIEGLAACGGEARLIDQLSGERIAQEMRKLLLAKGAADVIVLMQQYNVWKKIIPAAVGVATLRRLPAISAAHQYQPAPMLALALVLRTALPTAEVIEQLETRWKLSQAESKHLRALCLAGYIPTQEAEQKKFLRQLGADAFRERIILAQAEEEYTAEEATSAIALTETWQIPVFPVTGNDLKEHGFTSGKGLGDTLKRLEAEWESSGYALSKEALLDRIKPIS